ncbi:hypothetical protein ACQ4LF_24030, partial [Aeromonas salmonicida]
MLRAYSGCPFPDPRHYTYDDVDAVPYNRVPLVSATPKYLFAAGSNTYSKTRFKPAANFYTIAKVNKKLAS